MLTYVATFRNWYTGEITVRTLELSTPVEHGILVDVIIAMGPDGYDVVSVVSVPCQENEVVVVF